MGTRLRLRMRTYVAAAVLIPLMGSTTFGLLWANDRKAEAQVATEISAQTRILSALSTLEFSVQTHLLARSYGAITTGAVAQIDNEAPENKSFININIDQYSEALADLLTTSHSLQALTSSKGGADFDWLIKTHPEATTSTPNLVVDVLERAAIARLNTLSIDANERANRAAVSRTVLSGRITKLQKLMVEEGTLIINVLTVPEPTAQSGLDVSVNAGRQQDLIDEIAALIGPRAKQEFLDPLEMEAMNGVRAAVAKASGVLTEGPDLATAISGDVIARAQRRYFVLPALLAADARNVTSQATAEADLARDRYQLALWLAGSLILLSLGLVVVLIRGIQSRLRSLERRARRIAEGVVDSQPLPTDGPQELAAVATAFNEVSSLVGMLDRQIAALGQGRLTAPALREVLPGKIGAELQRSVEHLTFTTNSLQQSQALSEAIVDAAVDAILTVGSSGLILSANNATGSIFRRDKSELIGLDPRMTLGHLPAWVLFDTAQNSHELMLQRADGEQFEATVSVRAIASTDGERLRTIFIRDISERKAYETSLHHKAHFDDLTGLANRTSLVEFLNDLDADPLRRGSAAIFLINLDRFRLINDALGHEKGNFVLRVVSTRLAETFGDGFVARGGGDEFVVWQDAITTHEEALQVGKRIRSLLREPIQMQDRSTNIDLCIGIALAQGDTPHLLRSGSSHLEALRSAEIAAHLAKSEQSDNIRIYDHRMGAILEQRTSLEHDLRIALTNGDLEMFCQPIVELSTGKIRSGELLARWNRDGEWVSPDQFIPVAEESGLITPLGAWALDSAAGLLEELWLADIDISISVNISGLHLIVGTVLADLDAALQGRHFPAERMQIELTESFLLGDPELAIKRLNELRDRGPGIVIDDFGTGFSSLAYLQRLPITGMKLDKSFVDPLIELDAPTTIVDAVSDLGRGLGLSVVAEGIEHAHQAELLADSGYEFGQGYLWHKPMPIAEFLALINQSKVALPA